MESRADILSRIDGLMSTHCNSCEHSVDKAVYAVNYCRRVCSIGQKIQSLGVALDENIKQRRASQMNETKKEEYLALRKSGYGRTNALRKLFGPKSVSTGYKALSAWGIKDAVVEERLLASGSEAPTPVKKSATKEDLAAMIKEVKDARESDQAEISKLRSEASGAEGVIKQLRSELESSKQVTEDLRGELISIKLKNSDLESEVQEVTQQRDGVLAEKYALMEEMAQRTLPEESDYALAATTADAILQRAAGHMQDRAATYDKPQGERSMGKVAAIMCTLYDEQLARGEYTEEMAWGQQVILKLVRSSQGGYRADNFEDMAAYAALMGECAARERERERGKGK